MPRELKPTTQLTVMEILTTFIGRAMRADDDSKDMNLPKDQRDFHAGRRETCLQVVAMICGSEVKDIRSGVLGTKPRGKHARH